MQSTFLSGGRTIRLNVTQPTTPGPHPAILLLHGAGGNVDYWLDRIAPAVARLGIAVYAVHYFDRTSTTRADLAMLADGKHVPLWLETVRDSVTHIATKPGVDQSRIALIGISLGAFLSLALAATPGAPGIRAIVEISGGLVTPYRETATRAFPPTLIVHGTTDTVVALSHAEKLQALLTQLGTPHQSLLLPNESHWFTPIAQARILAAVAAFLNQYL